MVHRRESGPKIVETVVRKVIAPLTIAAMAMAGLDACATDGGGPVVGPTSSPSASEKPSPKLSLEAQMEKAIAARPAEGTPAYFAQFKDMQGAPATETDPAKVIDAYSTAATITWVEKIVQDAPGGGDETAVTDWQVQNPGQSLQSLENKLNIGYFTEGAANALWGSNANTPEAQYLLSSTVLPAIKKEVIYALNTPGSAYNKPVSFVSGSYDIQKATSTEIVASTTGAGVLWPGQDLEPQDSDSGVWVVDPTTGHWVGVPQKQK